jgi:hypothetical protein
MGMMMEYVRTALSEWDMSLKELDQVSFVRPAGIMSAAEAKSRSGR